jgi:folate-dependent phosphoribosylglycinamide formyltransferase PurN
LNSRGDTSGEHASNACMSKGGTTIHLIDSDVMKGMGEHKTTPKQCEKPL